MSVGAIGSGGSTALDLLQSKASGAASGSASGADTTTVSTGANGSTTTTVTDSKGNIVSTSTTQAAVSTARPTSSSRSQLDVTA